MTVIFNFLKYSIEESVVVPFIILIIQFCSLQIILLHEEFLPTLFHNSRLSENMNSIAFSEFPKMTVV